MNRFIPSPDHVRPLGRTLFADDCLWMAFSGSGAEFTLTGRKAVVTIAGDDAATLPDNADNQARIAIEVNGVRVVDDMIDEAEKTYTVLDCEEATTVVIRIVKLSETAMSTCAVAAIGTDADAVIPTARKAHRIEFVGDSITCGYGVDDEDGEHHFSTRTEDVTRAYAYRTAAALDAEYSMASISGYGIISGYTDSGKEPITAQTLPQYYDKLGFCYNAFRGRRAELTRWHFEDYAPELIVINLGTNDDSYTRDDPERQDTYAIAYTGFLKQVRAGNPDARILCTLGIMGDRLYPFVERAVADYTESTGDTNISCLRFDVQRLEDGYAADYHPTALTHGKAAEKLTAHIRSLMGW